MLEHLTDNRFDAIDDTNQIGADGCWLDPFMFKSFAYARSGNIDGEILRILDSNLDYANGKVPVTYIENHDHSTVVREAGGRGRWFKTQAPAISLLTSAGIGLLHNGQEFGEEYYLPSDGPDRVQPRPLRWNAHSQDFAGKRLFEIYRKLIRIRLEHPSLRSANFSLSHSITPMATEVFRRKTSSSITAMARRRMVGSNGSSLSSTIRISTSSSIFPFRSMESGRIC